MYTTDIQDNGTVSATDDERLPPGGFSLRHGFPQWFGRGRRTTIGSPGPRSNGAMSPVSPNERTQSPTPMSPYFATPGAPIPQPLVQRDTSMYSILKYIKSTFDNAEVLDTVPIDAAGNPGAWQAWRAHRRKLGKLPDDKPPGAPQTPAKEVDEPVPQIMSPKKPPATPAKHSSPSTFASPSKNKALPATPRKPGEWNWDGVWEDRVKKGISTSLSEPVLYGGATATDELVSWLRKQYRLCLLLTHCPRFASWLWMRLKLNPLKTTCDELWKEAPKSFCVAWGYSIGYHSKAGTAMFLPHHRSLYSVIELRYPFNYFVLWSHFIIVSVFAISYHTITTISIFSHNFFQFSRH